MHPRQCIVVGDEKTGKSALVQRLLHDEFTDDYVQTLVSSETKEYVRGSKKSELTVTEIGGTVNSPDLRARYYRSCDFVVLVFSLIDKSFENIKQYLSEINIVRPGITKILVGTNAENENRVIPFKTIKQFVTLNFLNRYYEVSNKDGGNIKKLLSGVFIPILFDPTACDDPRPSDASNFKICLWGAPGSGKTTFRKTLCGGSSEPSFYSESRGILKLLDKYWNVCIAEQYDGCDELRPLTLDGCNLLMLLCDMTDRDSISRIMTYNIPEKFPVVIVGVKGDISKQDNKNAVDDEDIDEVMEATGAILFAEGSAKNSNDCIQIIEESMSATLEWYDKPENQI